MKLIKIFKKPGQLKRRSVDVSVIDFYIMQIDGRRQVFVPELFHDLVESYIFLFHKDHLGSLFYNDFRASATASAVLCVMPGAAAISSTLAFLIASMDLK